MWIDTNRLRFDDFNPYEQFDEGELCSPEEQAEWEREMAEREREDNAYREAMERDQAEMDYRF
jgi:hypothetical protein